MTQNEVSIIKNAVLDATEAYVDARLETLAFVQTQIGVVIDSYKDTDSTHSTYKKYIHTVRCNATQTNPDGITYDNVLSVGNVQFPNNSVVFLVAPNGQYSNQFILGKLDDTPCNIVGGSIRLGGNDENDAPIYLTSTPYTIGNNKNVYGHIGSFFITQNGLRIEGDQHGVSEVTGNKFRLSEWKEESGSGYALSMNMDIDKAYIAFNTNGYSGAGVIVSDQYGWDGNGNFNDPTSGSSRRYTKVGVNNIEIRAYFDGSYQTFNITPQATRFLDVNQDELAFLELDIDSSGITFNWRGHSATLSW